MEERSCVILINVGNLFINFEGDQGKAKLLYQSLGQFKGYLVFLKIWCFSSFVLFSEMLINRYF